MSISMNRARSRRRKKAENERAWKSASLRRRLQGIWAMGVMTNDEARKCTSHSLMSLGCVCLCYLIGSLGY